MSVYRVTGDWMPGSATEKVSCSVSPQPFGWLSVRSWMRLVTCACSSYSFTCASFARSNTNRAHGPPILPLSSHSTICSTLRMAASNRRHAFAPRARRGSPTVFGTASSPVEASRVDSLADLMSSSLTSWNSTAACFRRSLSLSLARCSMFRTVSYTARSSSTGTSL